MRLYDNRFGAKCKCGGSAFELIELSEYSGNPVNEIAQVKCLSCGVVSIVSRKVGRPVSVTEVTENRNIDTFPLTSPVKVIASVQTYSGISAGVKFTNGVGYTSNPNLIQWFIKHGYLVEKS